MCDLTMEQIDIILYPLIPILILIHLLAAPYTKVEESFNIQAIHDISRYGIPFQNVSESLRQSYDHFEFPGAVPRTFVGALSIAGVAKPIIHFTGLQHAQFIVRAVLGLFNAVAFLRFKKALEEGLGKNAGRWYVLLQASQFHVIYYASRTLPNMFAFGLTTLALKEFLPTSRPLQQLATERRQRRAIFLLVFSGVVFRSEIAILLFSHLAYLLARSRISLSTIIGTGVISAAAALAISVPIDSYFWQKPIWPEFAGFYYNAIEGKSADWGVSPFHYYFSSCLPRLLLNPLIFGLIPTSLFLSSTTKITQDLVIPHLIFIAIYSFQPHKEARFIIYPVPAFTAAASLSASYIWTRRSKNLIYLLASVIILLSVVASFAGSTAMLVISSLNYPGGDAIARLHTHLSKTTWPELPKGNETIKVHMDVLSCMTGVSRFQELPWRGVSMEQLPIVNGRPVRMVYDKSEDPKELLKPEFWAQFDYLLMEDSTKAIGAWEVVDSIYAYAGIEILRPGDGSSFSENLERLYAANNITKNKDGAKVPPSSGDVQEALKEGKQIDHELDEDDDEEEKKARLLLQQLGNFGTYKLVRDAFRQVTGGYWIGPRMEPKIRILKKVQDPLSM